jgi:hypothetical protein
MMKAHTKNEHRSCQVCGTARIQSLHPSIIVRPALAEEIQSELGHWDPEGWICDEDLQRYRHKHVEALLQAEKGELTELEKEVLERYELYVFAAIAIFGVAIWAVYFFRRGRVKQPRLPLV